MSSDELYADRKRLTFEQAEGVEPLPTQLRQKEMSPLLVAGLRELVYQSIMKGTHRDNLSLTYVL